MKYHHPLTCHHKLTQAYGGNSQPGNLIQLRQNVHQAIHTVFQDDTPLQRLRRMIEIDKSTLHPDVYAEINKVLTRFEALEINVYDPRLFDSDLFLKRMKKGKQ